MQSLEIIGFTKDVRTKSDIIYAQIEINDYLELVGEKFDQFEIQRKREKHKGYNRLKQDIKNGALIPTITLAVEPSSVDEFSIFINTKDTKNIKAKLKSQKDKIRILDGLQRTFIIDDLNKERFSFIVGQKLLLEIWFESDIKHLIYRLIVLNSGQKPMSMRHQIELLFITMKETLLKKVIGLKILEEKDEEKRNNSKEFPFERLVTSYKSYLTKTPEVDKDNVVAERMIESDMLESDEKFLSDSFIKFSDYLKTYCLLDEQVYRIYKGTDSNKYRNWLAESNVIQSFFAAIKMYSLNEEREKAVNNSIQKLLKDLETNTGTDDTLHLNILYTLLSDESIPKKFNVGFATRKLLSKAFVEYFRSEGDQSLKDCWTIASFELYDR